MARKRRRQNHQAPSHFNHAAVVAAPLADPQPQPPPPPQHPLFQQFAPNNSSQNPSNILVHFLQYPNQPLLNNLPQNLANIASKNPNFQVQDANFQPQSSNFQVQDANFQPQNPNFYVQDANFGFQQQNPYDNSLLQNPNLLILNGLLQSLTNPIPIQNPNFQIQNVSEALERIDRAVVKVRSDILASGDYVSASKVSREVLSVFKVDSWESLGFHMHEIPSLHHLMVTEGKVNTFIHCHVGVRSITTLYDLELAVCENEGVEQFEELKLGPLVRQPLVKHYFSVGSDIKDACRITSKEIISYLYAILKTSFRKEVRIDELLDFISEKRSTSREKLNVRIESLGSHVACIRKAVESEKTVLKKFVGGLKKKYVEKFEKKFGLKIRNKCLVASNKKGKSDDYFNAITQRIMSISAHVNFPSSSSSHDDGGDNVNDHDNLHEMDKKCDAYTGLHDLFVNECEVEEIPPLQLCLQNLMQWSTTALPSQVARSVFNVFSKWADEFICGSLSSGDFEYLKERLLKKECAVLPSAQDKWVSLNPSFGLVCWSDDDKLETEFSHLNGIHLLYFGHLADDEKELLQTKVATLMSRLGIPALSRVVSQKAIYYGPKDSSSTASLVNWALPYAQRYIYHVHPDRYLELKKSGFYSLRCLKVVEVKKLFSVNIVKTCGVASERRVKCTCLLQGNILYATQTRELRSIFMQLSSMLLGDVPEMCLENFLHMIENITEAGSSEEQIEVHILNSLKLPKFPHGESIWSLNSISVRENNELHITDSVSTVIDSIDAVNTSDGPDFILSDLSARNQLCSGTTGAKAAFTGRLGEFVAFKYFVGRVGRTSVKWVNEAKETGLPYDLLIGNEEQGWEYIEVKATKSRSNKRDSAFISVREWQFAVEKGESFSIAQVILLDDNTARITTYKNPLKLCQLGKLRLAVIMPKQLKL
ncbi:hypothetical protein ACH5RR_031805 [Cinchona calisaya]|uniref:Protein NO VEIN C-terminal domain-containing protein n=1 Tax=Cinchona calisaya TaxID=153742 RepID=A0ABD2YHC4_9GENT